jgi:hypothetical protein
MPNGLFVDAATGETIQRELTAEEIAATTRPEAEVAAERHAEIQAARRGAFQTEADPLYFAWQRGEATEEDWLAKCAEIRARYPYA